MNSDNLYMYIYENLEYLTDLSKSTKLYICRQNQKLYTVKTAPAASLYCYQNIMYAESPYLARVLYISNEEENICIMREYISGDRLSTLTDKGTLGKETAFLIAYEICSGLEALHLNGIVHRDINPNNIIITPDFHARIIDYGIARSFREPKSKDTVIMGTPGYAAPEQFGFSQSDNKTDIYAVGVLLNVMLTGKLPNERTVSGKAGKIISKCTAIDPVKRYKSVSELCTVLKGKAEAGGNADKFIKNIPGLRSEHAVVVILSIIGYIAAGILSAAIVSSAKPDISDIVLRIFVWIFLIFMPFVCFNNFLGIWDKLPFTSGSSKRSQRIIFTIFGIVSIFISIILISLSSKL